MRITKNHVRFISVGIFYIRIDSPLVKDTSKTHNGVTTTYYLDGDRIVGEEKQGNITLYIYDTSGTPIGMQYHGASYTEDAWDVFWYEKNLQGDIVAVYDESGTLLITYIYDAWGDWASMEYNDGYDTAAYNNPFRYRGYYYEDSLFMYYLGSRYYDQRVGRFINPDEVMSGTNGSLHGFNLYVYCFNNPIMYTDPNGNWPEWVINSANWLNSNIVQPVVDFFNPRTNSIGGDFENDILFGSGSLTAGYSDVQYRFNNSIKSSGTEDKWFGGFFKASAGNVAGEIGLGNDKLSTSIKCGGDALAATAQAGLHFKDGLGIGAKAKASVLSGRLTREFNIFGFEVELGLSAEILSIGAEATVGLFPTSDGGTQLDTRCNVGGGLFGWGYVFRIKCKQ